MSDSPVNKNASTSKTKRPAHIDRFVLQIHSASFPADPDEDVGRGSPYSRGAMRLFEFAAKLGFNAIQLGPAGMTDRGNPSPYDAAIFARNPLDLPFKRYVDEGRLSGTTWQHVRQSLSVDESGTASYPTVHDSLQTAIAEIIRTASADDRAPARRFLHDHQSWLEPDALYQALSREHGHCAWPEWTHSEQGRFDQRLFAPAAEHEQLAWARRAELRRKYAKEMEDYALIQWLLAEEALSLRTRLHALGLTLYGDLQVGFSLQDVWAWQGVFIDGYRMGAPPSRTNPAGQPWGYYVIDPNKIGTRDHPGPGLQFVRARMERLLSECDGVRIDHPHGWIDPWVYRIDDADSFHAVQHGARLYSSPNEPGHPELAGYAIARPDQIDAAQPRYADGRVKALDDDQVRRYSILVDEIVQQLTKAGHPADSIACEVLSTLPYPVQRVLERHGIGRFRVTQKLNLNDPADVYRIENAQPQDWIMLGTHDTPTIWSLAEQWCRDKSAVAWAGYLAKQLPAIAGANEEIAEAPGRLVNSLFAAMLKSRARNVVVFFPDLFGMTKRYNEPGVISERNWSLRVPTDFESRYAADIQHGRALDVAACFGVIR